MNNVYLNVLIFYLIYFKFVESSCLFFIIWKDKMFKDFLSGLVIENIYFYGGFVRWLFIVYGINIFSWDCYVSNENEIVIKG